MAITLILVGVATYFVYSIYHIIYVLYFHPLAKVPGPKLWIAFPVIRLLYGATGYLNRYLANLHDHYGDVVRFTDDSVSFIRAQAWKDTCAYGQAIPRQPSPQNEAKPDIIFSNDADHARYRKALSHAFSDKGLREQEPLVRKYINKLISCLESKEEKGEAVNMVMWYDLTTFDLISDLAFGKTAGCLDTETYQAYVANLFKFMQVAPVIRLIKYFPPVWGAIVMVFGTRLREGINKIQQYSNDVALERINDTEKQGRGDFMDAMARNRGTKDGLSDDELGSNSNILFMAGSETSSTALAGATFWLLKTPNAMKRVTEELRSTFSDASEMNFASVTEKCPYLAACINEGLRIYPSVPGMLPRIPPKSVLIDGVEMPAGSEIHILQTAMNWSSRNFHRSKEFIPERWLPDSTSDPKSEFYNDNRDVFQPFGVGPRNCIGRNLALNEMKLILSQVLWNFDLELVDKKMNWPHQKIYFLWSKRPLMVNLKSATRHKQS